MDMSASMTAECWLVSAGSRRSRTSALIATVGKYSSELDISPLVGNKSPTPSSPVPRPCGRPVGGGSPPVPPVSSRPKAAPTPRAVPCTTATPPRLLLSRIGRTPSFSSLPSPERLAWLILWVWGSSAPTTPRTFMISWRVLGVPPCSILSSSDSSCGNSRYGVMTVPVDLTIWPSVRTATRRVLLLEASCSASITSGVTSDTYGRNCDCATVAS
mmetsp:Transcript_15475/g.45658  ORF Transcript_15475/g.45658 Transcript_15475/m.45658 type:complete len:215 (-) Transcript_15475:2570-3214(-)